MAALAVAQHRKIHSRSQQPDDTPGSGGVFKPAESDEEWLELDGKVNEYPTSRTFKAIGTGGQVSSFLVRFYRIYRDHAQDREKSETERLMPVLCALQEFADSMVAAVEKVTTRTVDKRFQVVKRPSREGKYLSVSIRSVTVDSGRQVLDVFREMKSTGGRQLKFII